MEKNRIGWLGMRIGERGREIHSLFKWAQGEQDSTEATMKKFETYVRHRKNKLVARYKLKYVSQSEVESFDNFVKTCQLILLDCSMPGHWNGM